MDNNLKKSKKDIDITPYEIENMITSAKLKQYDSICTLLRKQYNLKNELDIINIAAKLISKYSGKCFTKIFMSKPKNKIPKQNRILTE